MIALAGIMAGILLGIICRALPAMIAKIIGKKERRVSQHRRRIHADDNDKLDS
jgi:hypothetical protein